MTTATTEINDARRPIDFRGYSFSKYKKTDVKKALINNIYNGKIEPACYWAAEFICAGHYYDLWETIIYYVSKHIHTGNIKIVCYLNMRYQAFRDILADGTCLTELHYRNHNQLRRLFAEIITVLTISPKKPSFEIVKLNRNEEFDIRQMEERFKAPSANYCRPIFREKDPDEVFIALNEFSYHISSESRNAVYACYWTEWIMEFEVICKKRKDPILCGERRNFVSTSVDNRFARDIVWLIWDSLLHEIRKRGNQLLRKTMESLLDLYQIKYTAGCFKKRRYILYYAINLCTELAIDNHVDLVTNKKFIEIAITNIDDIYSQIKINEVKPGTDYLFNGLDKALAMEKSLERLNMALQMGNNMGSGGPDLKELEDDI